MRENDIRNNHNLNNKKFLSRNKQEHYRTLQRYNIIILINNQINGRLWPDYEFKKKNNDELETYNLLELNKYIKITSG